MNEVKVSLNISLPGRVMFSQEEAKSLEKQGLVGYDKHSLVVEDFNHKTKKRIRETIYFKTRKCIPAVQSLNINKESYDYMTGKDVPSFSNAHDWSRLSKKLKLEAHLNEIALSLGGKVVSYHIFED